MLEAENKLIKLYHAGSGECYGNTQGESANDGPAFCPISPYGVAKPSAYWLVNNYRKGYGLFACADIFLIMSRHYV